MLLCMLNTQHCMNAVTCGLQDMHGGKHVQERKQEVLLAYDSDGADQS